MLKLEFTKSTDSRFTILCLGAHSDDIEIGCGGSILKLLAEEPNLEIHWIVFSSNEERANEARNSADLFLSNAKYKNIIIKNYKDGFFPYIGGQIKDSFEELKKQFDPDVIFTHYRHDLHQDHRLISELTWNTFRNHFILEYEIIKYDGDLGRPNFYISLDKEICLKKIDIILNTFKSQKNRGWFTTDAFMSIMRLRGIEINALGNYAEAFYGRKITLL
jgi:LmbE family N-acetylglucosaminyl deacetylase